MFPKITKIIDTTEIKIQQRYLVKKYDLVISDETFELWMGMNKDREMVKVPVLEIGDYLGIEPISWNPKERIFAFLVALH